MLGLLVSAAELIELTFPSFLRSSRTIMSFQFEVVSIFQSLFYLSLKSVHTNSYILIVAFCFHVEFMTYVSL
jgi:hypothetical protein